MAIINLLLEDQNYNILTIIEEKSPERNNKEMKELFGDRLWKDVATQKRKLIKSH